MREIVGRLRAFWRSMAVHRGARSDPLAGASRRLLDALLSRRRWNWVHWYLRDVSGEWWGYSPYPYRSRPPS
ncbi:MAG TPA: hypothetical protein PLQ00_03330 [Thermoguttaceae bacterium]|nr:hypothetical protein [Thermoguttaceae bacterium]